MTIDCVSVADCSSNNCSSSSNSTSLLSPISIMSLVSEPTSLDTPVPMADDTQNALTDLSVSLGSETPADSASRSQPVTAWHSNSNQEVFIFQRFY